MLNADVEGLAFYDAKGRLLAYRGGQHALKQLFNPPEFRGNYIENQKISSDVINFTAPISLPHFNLYTSLPFISNLSPILMQSDHILGWLSININTQSTMLQRYQMYIATIIITAVVFLLGLLIHHLFAKRIYLPISQLRRHMQRVLSNDFSKIIEPCHKGEIGLIEKGISHLQREYLNMSNELNQHIETATADLQQSLELLEEKNIQLSLEKKKIEEKSQHKIELIANISHEIRTPMNGVIGFANVLLESKLDPLQVDYVKTIKSSAQDLLTLINDILDYSKMDAGKLVLESIPFDIRTCVDEVLSLLAPQAHKKNIEIISSNEINVPRKVLGDSLRFKQMLTNLINNAIKFTEKGYVYIHTFVVHESEKQYTLAVEIKDTGIGISAEAQTTLFNAFNQGNAAITRRYGGSGLGLVICKKLAEQMQGKISLTSELNQGSTFLLQVKLEKLIIDEQDRHYISPFKHLKAICYDSNPLYLDGLCNSLQFLGVHCEQVHCLTELEKKLNSHHDVHLAFIGTTFGQETIINNIVKKQCLPYIIIGHQQTPYFDHLSGMIAFLYKPTSLQKLQDVLSELYSKNKNPSPCLFLN